MSLGQPRLIDPRGHRFGAACSVVLLVIAFLLAQPLIVASVAVCLGVSAWYGTRYSVLGRPWPYVRRLLRVGPPAELEPEWPPRFAQAIGCLALSVATILFLAGVPTLAWLATAAVAALQMVLALTGYCLGCRLYFLSWKAPVLFRRLAR